RVITRATRPVGKSHPRGLLTIAAAGILSFIAAFGLALVLSSLDHVSDLLRQAAPQRGLDEVQDARIDEFSAD
ncbi:MAG: hypothetical protein ABL908_20035, partial [Hyphomicrobium sp.]